MLSYRYRKTLKIAMIFITFILLIGSFPHSSGMITNSSIGINATGNVLILSSDTTSSNSMLTILASQGITTDTFAIDTGTPTLTDLISYTLIIVITNNPLQDRSALGNALADYVDQGGKVIIYAFGFILSHGPLGRFNDSGYHPMIAPSLVSVGGNYDGESVHPIFTGVNSLTTFSANLTITNGATLIASLTTGFPLAVVKGSVLSINTLISATSGDLNVLALNAVNFYFNYPTIEGPSDFNVEFGTTGNTLTWITTRDNPKNYTIYRNDVAISFSLWGSTLVIISVDFLNIGTYNYTIQAFDNSERSVRDTVFITVVDTIAPTVSFPADITYIEGTTGNIITWTPSDPKPSIYIVTQDGTQYKSGSWSNGVDIVVNIDGLTLGTYSFTITVTDSSNNEASDTVMVIVTSGVATNPTVTSPPDQSYVEGSTGNSISWTATDDDPGTYTITNNSVEITSGNWVSGIPIALSIDELGPDTYTYVITIFDTSFNSISDIVILTVTRAADTINPIVTSPPDQLYVEGSTGNSISWMANDDNPGTYTITNNSIEIASGIWVSGTPIIINIDALLIDTYIFNITVFDTSFNSVWDIVLVTVNGVVDSTAPVITSPADISYEEGTTGNLISWTGTDDNPGTFTITRDGQEVAKGDWNSGTAITINVDGLAAGATYTFIITIYDSRDNSVFDFVTVTVEEKEEVVSGDGAGFPIPFANFFVVFSSIICLTLVTRRKRGPS
ncbi:MAG: hypothetical protein IH840_03710 [Candidatus Heimdallarchaeota archaeon]|nr:hypothetical protein [Candidatus Heimdallarchaeota archaeon]